MNPYETLGISPNATPQEIKRAYRRLVLEYHPDRVPEHLTELKKDAEETFKTIVEAFQILSDARARQKYDDEIRTQDARNTRTQKAQRQAEDEDPRRTQEAARKRAEDEAFWRGVERTQQAAAERLREQRLRALRRKKRLLITLGIFACLALLSPLLIAGARWTQHNAHRLWWRASSLAANTEGWRVEGLHFYPVSRIEKMDAPNATAVLRGSIQGLNGCFLIPARGTVLSETGEHARIRVEFQRVGPWNRAQSFLGSCTPDFVPIEAFLEGQSNRWTGLDLLAVDLDTDLEYTFLMPPAESLGKRPD